MKKKIKIKSSSKILKKIEASTDKLKETISQPRMPFMQLCPDGKGGVIMMSLRKPNGEVILK